MSTTDQGTTGAVGLFIVSYAIGNDLLGGRRFEVHLVVDTPSQRVTGMGRISQAVNPPLDLATQLTGTFTYMTVMPNQTHILVTATGHPPLNWPHGGGIGPVILPNVDLQMVLSDDWSSGTANYRYTTDSVTWESETDQPVRKT